MAEIVPGIKGRTFKLIFDNRWLDGLALKAQVLEPPRETANGYVYKIKVIGLANRNITIKLKQALYIIKNRNKIIERNEDNNS